MPLTDTRQLLGEQHHDPGDVEGLNALRQAAAGVDLLDRLGVDVGVALEELVDHEGAHLVRSHRGQRALEGAADRGPDGVDDHCFGHGFDLLAGSRKAQGSYETQEVAP